MHRIAFYLLLVAPLVFGATPDECSGGESYWCSNIKSAKECGAIQHCTDTVWKNQRLDTMEAGEVCQFCEGIIGDIRNFLTKKETQESIKQYADMACKTIPDAGISADCQQVFNSFFPEIMSLIESELDGAAICSAMGLCSGFADKVEHPHAQKSLPIPDPFLLGGAPIGLSQVGELKGDICKDCKALVGDIKSQVTSDATEKQIEDMLKNMVCASLGGLESECDTLVEQYVPELMGMLAADVDPLMVCQALQFCQGNGHNMLAKLRFMKSDLYKYAAVRQNDEECSVCKLAMTELASYLDNADDQKAVMDFIKQNLCARLGSMDKQCESSVDQYGPILFALVKEELSNPEGLCQSLGFCTAKKVDISRENTILKSSVAEKNLKVKDSTQCTVCKLLFTEAEELLKGNKTQQEVEDYLLEACGLLPDSLSAECKDFVKTYEPAIFELLLNEVSPSEFCSILGLCQNKFQSKSVKGGEYCGACETVLMYVDSLITQNATVQEIEKTLDKVCNFVPDTLKDQCDNLVKQYGPQVAKMIAEDLDPQKICAEIGLCTSTKKDTTLRFAPMQEIVPAKARLLGEKKCTYGPAYWCKDRATAEKCKAVPHCENHVWNK